MKRMLKFSAKITLAIVATLVLLEAAFTAWALIRFGTIDVKNIERMQTGNATAATDQANGKIDAFYPHPYLSYVRAVHGDQTGGQLARRVNNIGMSGRDLPLTKDPTKFTILVIGGSVAHDMAVAGEGDQCYIEEILNANYDFGRPVQVLCGGNTGWTALHAEIFYSMYGEVGDAVITITGFNERRASASPRRAEYPHLNFVRINPAANSSFSQLGAAWQAQQLKDFSFSTPLRSVYFPTWAVRRRLESMSESADTETQISSMFMLPNDWTIQQRVEFNLSQHTKYLKLIDALAVHNGVPRAHVIQPVPAVGKSLTPDEYKVVVSWDYGDEYNRHSNELISTGLPMVDLRQIFADHPETIYCDSVHCAPGEQKPGDQFRPSPGYRLMAERIAHDCARLWGIPQKPQQQGD